MARTGRVFECLSKKGAETSLMKDYFTIGKRYYEADVDILGENFKDKYSFLLYSDPVVETQLSDGSIEQTAVPMYVDAMDFEYVAQTQRLYLN